MIVSGTSPLLYIDLGRNESGMTLQRRERGKDWQDYRKDGKVVRSPIDIDELPSGRYRLE